MCHLFRNKGQTNPTFIILYAITKTARDKRCLCAVLVLVWMYPAFVYRTKDECKLNIKYNV